jgi:hypothetical protein
MGEEDHRAARDARTELLEDLRRELRAILARHDRKSRRRRPRRRRGADRLDLPAAALLLVELSPFS